MRIGSCSGTISDSDPPSNLGLDLTDNLTSATRSMIRSMADTWSKGSIIAVARLLERGVAMETAFYNSEREQTFELPDHHHLVGSKSVVKDNRGDFCLVGGGSKEAKQQFESKTSCFVSSSIVSFIDSAISLADRNRRDRCWFSLARGATPSIAMYNDTLSLTIVTMRSK